MVTPQPPAGEKQHRRARADVFLFEEISADDAAARPDDAATHVPPRIFDADGRLDEQHRLGAEQSAADHRFTGAMRFLVADRGSATGREQDSETERQSSEGSRNETH